MIEKIHIIVALFAALAITILSLFQDITFYSLCIRLVVIIPIFYILGLLFRYVLNKLFASPQETKVAEDAAEGDNTDGDAVDTGDEDEEKGTGDESVDEDIYDSYNPYDVNDDYS